MSVRPSSRNIAPPPMAPRIAKSMAETMKSLWKYEPKTLARVVKVIAV